MSRFTMYLSTKIRFSPQKYKHTASPQHSYSNVIWGIQKPDSFIYPHLNAIIPYKQNTGN